MISKKHRLFLLAAAAALPGCTAVRVLEAQSRIDPQTIALYNVASGITACPSMYSSGQYVQDASGKLRWVPSSVSSRARAPGDFHDGAIPLHCLKDESGKSIYDAALPATSGTNVRSVARNRLAAMLMKHSDDVCTVELGRLTSREAMVNTGFSVLTSGLSTASSLATGDVLKSILAGGASLSNATRTHVNAEVYRNALSTAVSKAIQTRRDEQRTAIISRFDDPADRYTVDQMVMEVNTYHQTCSFDRGLGLVIEAVSRPSETESAQLLRSQAVLAQRHLQVASLQQQLAAVPAGEAFDAQRNKVLERIQRAQDKYEEAVDALSRVGTTNTPPPPASDTSPTPPPSPDDE